MWTKVSICLFLLRIPFKKSFIRPLQAALVVLILSNVILTILWIVQCRPVDAAWDSSIHGACFSKRQRESIILAQASKLQLLVRFPRLPRDLLLMLGVFRSNICCIRLFLCCLPHPALVGRSDTLENQSGPLLLDGTGCYVSDVLRLWDNNFLSSAYPDIVPAPVV